MNTQREQWRIDAEEEWRERRRKDKENKRTKRKQRRRKQHDNKPPLSKGEALKEMHRLAEMSGRTMSAYPCEFCNWEWWHVGEYTRKIQGEREATLGKRVRRDDMSGNEITSNIGDIFGDKLKSIFSNED